jgi:hypothetical protein
VQFIDSASRGQRIGADDAAAYSRRVEPATVRINEVGALLQLDEPEGQAWARASAASQGIDPETQWVSCSSWSLWCRCRGGVTKVA